VRVQLAILKSLFKMIMAKCLALKGSSRYVFLPKYLLQLVELVMSAHASQKVVLLQSAGRIVFVR
jgi:hypothetical protein